MYRLITFCNHSVMYRKNKKYDTKFLYGDFNDYLYEIFLVIFQKTDAQMYIYILSLNEFKTNIILANYVNI